MLIGIDSHSIENNRTGVGRYLFNLLQEWSKLSSKFKVQSSKFILYFKDEIPKDLPRSPLFEAKLLNVRSTAKFIHWDLWRQAKRDKLDVLFCPEYVGPIFYRGKIAVILHDIGYEACPKEFNWPSLADRILLKWVSKKIAKRAKIIFVPVEFVKKEVVKYYKVPEERVIVTGEGVDPAILDSDGQNLAELKLKLGIKDKFVFFLGQIFSRRHLPEVIDAFLKTCGSRPDWQILLAGKDRTDEKAVDRLVEEINRKLSREAILRVDFIRDTDLKLLYNACAFFVWLSDYEGFGLPPLEAMACGAPVITSDATSLKEVAGDATLLIKDNGNVEEIYQAMKRLVQDEGLCQELSKRGKKQAAKFTWEKCARITLENLTQI